MNVRNDRVLPQTRWISPIIVPFLVAGFIILYPDRPEQLFASTMKPRITPLLMGQATLRESFFGRAVFAR